MFIDRYGWLLVQVQSSSRSANAVLAFDLRADFCHSAFMKTQAFAVRLRANAPERQKRFRIISNQPSRYQRPIN